MKRSQVLKIIDDEYGKFVEDWIKADMNNLQDFVPLNERILSSLEKLGMSPPPVELHEGYEFIDCLFWEDEDEPT
jgi:hypothetical protein